MPWSLTWTQRRLPPPSCLKFLQKGKATQLPEPSQMSEDPESEISMVHYSISLHNLPALTLSSVVHFQVSPPSVNDKEIGIAKFNYLLDMANQLEASLQDSLEEVALLKKNVEEWKRIYELKQLQMYICCILEITSCLV